MAMTNEKFVDVAGIRTRYFEKGKGEPLVLVHGGQFGSDKSADAADDWDMNFEALSRWFHVYAIDKLGQGHTDNPRSNEEYTMAAVVKHAYGFLEAVGLRNVNLVGHSRGGYLVARLTLEHPEMVKSCIVVDSNSLAPGMGRDQQVMANAPEPRLTKEAQRWVLQRYSHGFDHISDEWLDALVRIGSLPKYREAVQKMAMGGPIATRFYIEFSKDKEQSLGWIRDGRLKAPTLLVWGYNDPTATIDQGYALFDLVVNSAPRSQMHIFNKSGHFSYREHPGDFNELIRCFVQHC